MSEKLIITRNRVVAKQSRREGVYNRTGDLSVICFGEEEQRNECEAIKNRRKRYVACDDVAGVAESDKASLVACNNFMSLLLRKRWTDGSNPAEQSKQKNNRHSFVSEKLIITRNRVVAKQSRREGVYNRTGDLSVICFGEEEQRNECEAIKNRRKRYVACDDVAGVAGFEPTNAAVKVLCLTA